MMNRVRPLLLIFIASLALICGCQTPPKEGGMPSGIILQDICKQYSIQCQVDNITQVILLEYKGHKAKALVGSPVVLIGQEKINLSAPLRRINSNIYVPEDFELKVIGPFGAVPSKLGFSGELTNLKVRTIVIDPGHGGRDPGTKGRTGIQEKEIVLDVAKRLKNLLEESGFKIIMTRESDTYPTLPQRTELATSNDVDLFVSIHANFMPDRRTQGMEVYYVKTQSKRDLDEEQRQKNERAYVRNMKATSTSVVQGIAADMMYQLKVSESGKLAMTIVHDASSNMDIRNRGARHCRYFVVRNTLVPAVLIETGYLSNKQEEKKLSSTVYRQKLAESIARSILTYASSS